MNEWCFKVRRQLRSFWALNNLLTVNDEIIKLQLKNKTIELYYDTTFNLGDFVFRQLHVNQQTFNTCCIYDSGEKISKVPRRIFFD